MRTAVVLLVVGLAASGCQNSCQALCTELAEYRDECDVGVGASEVESCIDDQASASADALRVCSSYGNAEVLRREWSCDDVRLYVTSPSELPDPSASDDG